MARSYRSLREAIAEGRGTERPFCCPVHDDAHASASVNVEKGVWYCPDPSTRLLTADLRWQQIGDLHVGDSLMGFDEEPVTPGKRQWRVSYVEAIKRIMQPCYGITFDDGRVIRASAGHQWLVETPGGGHRRWRATADLTSRKGGFVQIMQVSDVWERDDSWEAGYLAAAYDGEGSLIQRNRGRGNDSTEVRLLFYQKPGLMLDRVELALKAKGYSYGKYLRADGCYHLVIHDKRTVLRFLGQIRPKRLLARFDPNLLGGLSALGWAQIVSVAEVGEQEVVAMRTTTSTYVAEGLASHNCYACNASGKTQEGKHDLKYVSMLKDNPIPQIPIDLIRFHSGYKVSPYWESRYGFDVAYRFQTGTDPVTGFPSVPILNSSGTVLHGFVLRDAGAVKPDPKYKYPFGVPISRLLLGHHLVNGTPNMLVLVEGFSDIMALHQWPLPPGVYVCGIGGSGVHVAQAELVKVMNPMRVLVAMDGDDAGQKGNTRSLERFRSINVSAQAFNWKYLGVNDPGELKESPWDTLLNAATRQR